jgi:hypothetical protein
MQGFTATHVHMTEAQGSQKESQCFIPQIATCMRFPGSLRVAGRVSKRFNVGWLLGDTLTFLFHLI